MNTKIIATVKYLILLLIAGAFLLLAFRGMNVNKISKHILHADIFWVAVSGLISILAFVSRAYRWNMLIESTGYKPQLKKTVAALMIGYLANLALPRLGEVTRCGSLSKAESVPFTSLLGTVIIERLVDVLSLFVCLLLTAIIEYRRLGNFFHDSLAEPIFNKFTKLVSSPLYIACLIIFAVALIILLVLYVKRSRQKTTRSKFSQLWNQLIDGLRSIANLKRPGLFVFHSIAIWVLYFLSGYVCFFALPATAHLGFSAALFVLVAAGFGMSAPVQGGIGAYHLLVSQGLILYGISQEDGLAFATLLHTLQILLIVALGTVSLLFLFSKRGQIAPAAKN